MVVGFREWWNLKIKSEIWVWVSRGSGGLSGGGTWRKEKGIDGGLFIE
jgi:hypothetical protein